MIKTFKYLFILFIKICIYFFLYLIFGFLLLSLLWFFTAYLTTFFKFFIIYFIPIYFILSLYSINYSGYYKLKFFGYDVKLWGNYLYNIIILLKKIVYNYKWINIILFNLLLIISFNYEKIYFFFLIFFVIFSVLLYYLYNNLYKLKIYIQKYFLYFNCSIILTIIYLLKNENIDFNIDFNFDLFNNENYPDFILRIMSPRWLFKNSYHFLFPEYKKEIRILNEGLKFNDLYLKDRYFSKFRNSNLNLDYILIKKSINKSLLLYKNFINISDLRFIRFLKNIYIIDNYNSLDRLNNSHIIYQQRIHNKFLFNLNNNKSYNIINFNDINKNNIPLKYKNLYARSFLKELGLSKNLVVNTNLVPSKYNPYINNFYELKSNKILISLDKTINKYIDKIDNKKGIYCYNNNFILDYLRNKYSHYFLCLKLITLNSIDILDDSKLNNNWINFKNLIIVDSVKNKYNIYLNSKIYKPEIVLENIDNSNKIDKNIRVFDIELYIKYLSKYYKSFNINSNVINWLNDLFIIIFDSQRYQYNYWNEIMSLKNIEEKDAFNSYRNFMNNILYTYKKDLNIFSYHEFKRDGTHYEHIISPIGATKAVLINDDVKNFYYRFFNYNKDLEIFVNSYLWLSLEDSNIRLENFEYIIESNEYLNKYKNILNNYINKHLSDPNFNLEEIYKYIDKDLEKLNLQWRNTGSLEIKLQIQKVLQVRRILKLDFFIKNNILNDDILSSFFIRNDNVYKHYYLYQNNINYIFFDNLLNDYNQDFNVFEKINSFKNIQNNHLKLPKNYKDNIFISLYYEYIYYNKDLFKVNKNYDYLSFYKETETDIYMHEGELLNKMLLNNLNYFKNYIYNLNNFYLEVDKEVNEICNDINKELNSVLDKLDNITDNLDNIDKHELYRNESQLINELKKVFDKFTLCREYFLNLKKIINKINKFNEDMASNISKFNKLNEINSHSEVIVLNNENLIKYISENNIDIKYFQESTKILIEIFNEYEKLYKKIDILYVLVEKKYSFLDNDYYYNKMFKSSSTIYNYINNHKRFFKYKTLEDAVVLKELIRKFNNNNISFTKTLEKGQDYLMHSLNNLSILQINARNNFIKELKSIEEAISKKE